jgi:hypothetical protein
VIYRTEFIDGASVTSVVYDTDAQTVTTSFNDDIPDVRPFTPEESAEYEALDTQTLAAANTTEMVAESDTSVDKLVAVVEALNAITDTPNATINQNPAAIIKNLARECKTIARQVNREARLTSGRTEDTDTGPVTDV